MDLAYGAPAPLPPELTARLLKPTVRLSGTVDDAMLGRFFDQLGPVLDVEGAIVLELFTPGGDAEIGRRLAEEIRLLREVGGHDLWFLGKTQVASAGITVMAAFPPNRRYLTHDAALLIHGRRLTRTLELQGPLSLCRTQLEEALAEIEEGLRLQAADFERLCAGTGVSAGTLTERAAVGWRLDASEALRQGLVAGLV